MTLRKSALEQYGTGVLVPTSPGGRLTVRSFTAPSGSSTPGSGLAVLTSRWVVTANGCEPACMAAAPLESVKVRSTSLRPKAALAGLAASAATRIAMLRRIRGNRLIWLLPAGGVLGGPS